MLKREVVKLVLDGKQPPYVPWSFRLAPEAREKLVNHYGDEDMQTVLENHCCIHYGGRRAYVEDMGNHRIRDPFGVIFDQTNDRDIGCVENCLLAEPTLKNYTFPDPRNPRTFAGFPERIHRYRDCFQVFYLSSAIYERAWFLRGMENLMMDFIEHPDFVRELLDRICDYNIAHLREALKYDIDAVLFSDDWAYQHGLQMGPQLWREFIYPVIKRMYAAVKEQGRYVFIHCCGKVQELFDDLIEIGVDCFNPFQPEVMDIEALMTQYRGRLTFWGGLSLQKTLPFGTPEQVAEETDRLIRLGREGSFILAPAHAITADVPLENMLAMIDTVKAAAKTAAN